VESGKDFRRREQPGGEVGSRQNRPPLGRLSRPFRIGAPYKDMASKLYRDHTLIVILISMAALASLKAFRFVIHLFR